MRIYKIFPFLILCLFLCLLLQAKEGLAEEYAGDYVVGYENIFVPIDYDKSYLDVALWYPAALVEENTKKEDVQKKVTSRLQSLATSGKKYDVAKNADFLKIFDEENQRTKSFPLLVISNPPFANSESYASLAHAFAKAGYVVASLVHIGDWQQDMRYNSSALQIPLRSLHIKSLCEFLLNDEKYPISRDNISLLSFYETALMPFALYGLAIQEENYKKYCTLYPESSVCFSPYKEQILYLYEDTKAYKRNLHEAQYNYEIESSRANIINAAMNAEWKLSVLEAEKMNEPLPSEPKWLEVPGKPKEIDLYFPYIKNFYLIEPSYTFLFDTAPENIKMHAFFSDNVQITNEYKYLEEMYAKNISQYRLETQELLNLADKCTENEDDFAALCARISEDEHKKIIESFVAKINEINRGK